VKAESKELRKQSASSYDIDHLTGERLSLGDMERVLTYHEGYEVLRSLVFASTMHNRVSYPFLGGTIITLTEETACPHMLRRREELALVAPAARRAFEFDLVVPEFARILREVWEKRRGNGPVAFDLVGLSRKPVLVLVGTLLGLDNNVDGLWEVAAQIAEAATAEFTTRDVDEVIEMGLNAKRVFTENFYRPAAERRSDLLKAWRAGEIEESDLPVDLLTIMLKSPQCYSSDDIVKECCFYMAAALSSLANGIVSTCYEILNWLEHHPDDRTRLRTDVAFLQSSVSEAIRLHPPAPLLIRQALEDITLASGRRVAKGQSLIIDLITTSQDPSVFGDDAERFNPHRQTAGHIHRYGLSFGLGGHICLAKPLLVGAGDGSIKGENEVAGMLIRIMQELFAYDVSFDPADRLETKDISIHEEWVKMPLLLNRARL
jgi:cytochrome P450